MQSGELMSKMIRNCLAALVGVLALVLSVEGSMAGELQARPVPRELTLTFRKEACDLIDTAVANEKKRIAEDDATNPALDPSGAPASPADAQKLKAQTAALLALGKSEKAWKDKCKRAALLTLDEAQQIQKAARQYAGAGVVGAGADTGGVAGDSGASFVEVALQGLALYLMDRAEREAVRLLVKDLHKVACDSAEDAPPRQYFRSTCTILDGAVGQQGLLALGGSLRAALQKDLGRLVATATKDSCGTGAVARIVVEAAIRLEEGNGLVSVLSGIQGAVETCAKEGDVYTVALTRLSMATRLLANKGGVLEPSDIDAIEIANEINTSFLGADGKPVASISPDQVKQLSSAIRAAIAALQGKPSVPEAGGTGANAYRAYLTLGVRTLALALDIAGKPEAREIANLSVELVLAIFDSDFGRALLATQELVKAVGKDVPTLGRYGGLIADMASAKTSDDVKKAIEAAAEPVGAFEKKRKAGAVSAGLGAYLGGTLGAEYADDTARFHGGLSLPVGLEVSVGAADAVSFGLFVSGIDVGTLADFRVHKDDTDPKTPPAFEAAQVFAPGAFLTFGCCYDVPIAIGGGARLVPRLREDETRVFDVVQVGGFAGMDLPILLF
jgi:hypothetical protein